MKRFLLYILFTICFVCSIHADFSLVHQKGMYDALQSNGMQKTHTDYQIMYARPGETVYLYRPERSTFVGYVRWYCYDTDRTIPSWYTAEDSIKKDKSGNYIATPRIESTWEKDTLAATLKFKAKNDYGWFGYVLATDGKSTKSDENYVEIKYTMHNGDSIYRIACDQGIWNDYSPSTWDNNIEMTEPTLSKRIIFEIRPAKWIADSLELCKVTPTTPNNRYLEEHKLIAPAGRQLYIGPELMYHTKDVTLPQYKYHARSNYHYYNNKGEITPPSDRTKWKWYENGVYNSDITPGGKAAQFAPVHSDTVGTVIYTLKYEYATGYAMNVARFTVTYIDPDEVGPSINVPMPSKNMEKIYEENFNYDYPGITDFRFWNGYFDVDESTYGYYTKNISASNRQSKSEQNKITWSEYAITNRKQVWVQSGTAPQVYQHVDGKGNESNNAKEGYMLYCDGSQQPGLVFNLKIHADLCPGSTMYFYAWLCDASSTGDGKSAPNMDFVVTGIDDNGNEHKLTTFTTGEFGINAGLGDMERAKWYQIMFPVKFTAQTTYHTYRLRITNKSTSSDGNDFAIDDIRIYVEKPAVIPIQASTSDCIDKSIDSIRTYIRIDYKEIDHNGQPLYYQWRENDNIIHTEYYNIDGHNTDFGKVNIKPDNEITPSDTCSDLLAFDKRYRDTEEPVVRYILEEVGQDTFRYVMYIAMPMEVKINHEYTSFVSLSQSTLGDRTGCGTFADMIIAGGTRIIIDDKISFGDSIITVCGHRSYTLNIVLTKIVQDETQGELRIDTTHCRADWLIGDSIYVNSHPEIYKYSFDEIEEWIDFYHKHVPSAKQPIEFLKHHGLLILDTASIIMSPGVSLSYTAFPIEGSASDGRKVCTSPRFIHINPAVPASNMMEVGNITEVLPDIILNQPRIVRISNTQKNKGIFSIPMYLKGDKDEIYEIDSVHMISSTNPIYEPITLNVDHKIMSLTDTVIFNGGNKLKNLKAGYDYTFHIAFKGESDEDRCDRGHTYFTLRIVPDVVTWYGGHWNVDANWDYFIPMKETNVLLLDTDYIVSFNDTSLAIYDINYTKNQCDSIYFPYGSSMYGQELIVINGKAFIDVKEYPWKWTLTSIPIKGVVSGDFFVKVEESEEPFVIKHIDQNIGDIAYDRTTWQLYRKVFDVETKKWQSSTNSLIDRIEQGSTDMIGVDCENENDIVIIRFPKQDNMYRYYDKNTHLWLAHYEQITSRSEDYGKPIWNGDTVIKLKEPYNNVYLFGNPTFGYIDVTELIDDNRDKFTGKYYFEEFGAYTIPKKTDDIDFFNGDVDTLKTNLLLPPYRGILLEGTRESDSVIINLTTKHINKGSAPKRRTYNNDNGVTTNIDYVTNDETPRIYDIMGRYFGSDFNKLPSGIYIIRRGKNTQKVFIGR